MPRPRRGIGASKRHTSASRRIWLRFTTTCLGFIVTTVGLRFSSILPSLHHQIAANSAISHQMDHGSYDRWPLSRTDSHSCFRMIGMGSPFCNRNTKRDHRKSVFRWMSHPTIKAPSNTYTRHATFHTDDESPMIHHRELIVTIGPPCSGKTTFLRKVGVQEEQKEGGYLTDVCIDNHPAVYFKVPLRALFHGAEVAGEYTAEVQGRPLSERLRDQGVRETSMVAARLLGDMTADEFSSSVQQLRKVSPAALAALQSAVENSVRDGVRISTATADIFVREALFPLAIKSSQRKLEALARNEDGMVAWGNTNSQVRDFRGALEQARRTGRPVRFVRWGHELPLLSLTELLTRNIRRFASTGRYIETSAIENSLARIERMLASTGGGDPGKLALAAGYAMDTSGGLTRLPLEDGVKSASFFSTGRLRNAKDIRPRRTGEVAGGSGTSDTGDWDGLGTRKSGTRYQGDRGRSTSGEQRVNLNGRATDGDCDSRPGVSPQARGRELGGVSEKLGECNSVPLLAPPTSPAIGGEPNGASLFASGVDHVPLRLAQEWLPRGDSSSWTDLEMNAMGFASRSLSAELMPPTVVMKSEWGRMRAWRRSQFSEEEIGIELPDPSVYFNRANGTTRGLKVFQEDQGSMNPAEINLLRKIDEFRERR